MRATFYEALEVSTTSDVRTIRSALRAILRRFWSVPRDPSGDTEEAVRFVALGAAILTNDQRRDSYDIAARRGVTTNPWRVGNDGVPLGDVDMQALGVADSHGGDVGHIPVGLEEPPLLPAVRALTDPLPEHTLWDETRAYVISGIALSFAALMTFFGVLLWASSLYALIAFASVLVAAALVAAQVHIATTEMSGFTLARLAVTKWRREASVFIGNPPPQQDTSWIFRLRVMELTRSAAGYSSATNLFVRFLARAADYAMVACVLLAVLWLVGYLLPGTLPLIKVLRSPLLLPVLVVVMTIPLEAMYLARDRMTPGKFLLGVAVVNGVTYPEDVKTPTSSSLAWARATTFARSGACFGLWPLILLRWGALSKSLRVSEAIWEDVGDSVTLARTTDFVFRVAGVAVTIATMVGLLALWTADASALGASLTSATESSIAAIKAQQTDVAKPETAPAPVPPATATPNDMSVAQTTASNPVNVAPSAPTPTTSPVPQTQPTQPTQTPVSPPVAAPATAATATKPQEPVGKPQISKKNEFDKQLAVTDARRARIEAAEKRVAAARSSGNYAGLQNLCERWIEDQPGSADAWRCVGMARYQAGAGRDALPALRQALKLDPNDSQVERAIFNILRP